MIMIKATEIRKFLCLSSAVSFVCYLSFFSSLKWGHVSDKRYWHSFFFVQICFQNKLFITMICNNSSCLFYNFTLFLQPRTLPVKIKCFLVELSPLLSSKDNKEMNKKHMCTLSNRHFCDSVLFLCFWIINQKVFRVKHSECGTHQSIIIYKNN